MLNDGCICLIGNGVALHLETLMKEINLLEENNISCAGRILIANRTHLLFDYHKIIDGMQEEMKGKQKVGTTKRGIGPCYTDKVRRNGIRVHELLDFDKFEKKYRSNLEMFKKMYGDFEYNADEELAKHREFTRQIEKYIVDGAYYLHKALKENKRVLVEGANGALLDIDHGTYPYVTSSNPTIGGILTGTGLNAGNLENVIGIMKAYTTRVGAGPFPSELLDELGESIRENGGEYGATTGRPRRCGWFDAVIGSYSVMVNGMTEVNLTKLDVLTGIPELKIATEYHYDGNKLEGFPADLNILKDVEVKYETFE
jgi:adenylosuccinate synthase